MPIYEYECTACAEKFEKILPLAEYNSPQVCPVCGESAQKVVSQLSFILKGDNWPSKANRIKEQKKRHNQRLDQKTKDHVQPLAKLVPNVNGEQVDSWSDAKKLAADKGKDTSGYDAMVKKEKKT